MKYSIALVIVLLVLIPVHAQRVHIIPEPLDIKEREGVFTFNAQTAVCIISGEADILSTVQLFADKFKRITGVLLTVSNDFSDTSNCVLIDQRENSFNREAYILDISKKRITMRASSHAGIFYAMESLIQLLPVDQKNNYSSAGMITGKWDVPCALITDSPQYSYRGMHLDVSRHYFPASYIKRYLDLLAAFKINVFHWHLTDSHGWRLEIKKYPKLTTVGAWRADRTGIPMTIAEPTGKDEKADYGGFYTQEEVKDIVQYAKLLNIEIIPEIEMPGHCTAALVAYPQFSDLDNPTPLLMPCGYKGDLLHNFCAGYDSTYLFLQDILKEVMGLFPSPYIHIGGDEVRPGPWSGCSRCIERMKNAGLKDAKELQAYFTHRIDSFITASGKYMMGWDEILDADIAPSSVAMSWHGDSKALVAATKGNYVIMTPYRYTYFDFYQSPPALEEEITYARLSLDSVYAFNPMPEIFTAQQAKYIAGGEACLWTENIATQKRVEYMLLPRLCALSEALWTPVSRKNYSHFITKIERQFKRFDADTINYARSMYNVDIMPVYDSLSRKIKISLADQTHKYPIHYTLDGTIPTEQSLKYTVPLLLNKSAVLKAATFKEHKPAGKINTDSFALHNAMGGNISINKLGDGIFGTVEPYDGRWVVMTDSVVTIKIDLKKNRLLRNIYFRFMEDEIGNAYLPLSVDISGSADGRKYKNIYSIVNKKVPQDEHRHIVTYKKLFSQKIRYLEVVIHNANLNSDREKNIMLLDEIVVQ